MKVTVLATYEPHAAKGLMQGSDREAALRALYESVGGKMTGLMFTRGKDHVLGHGELPDQAAGMGLALAVRASGSVRDLVVLEELDMKAVIAAAKKAAGAYKPAG
jgi:uncharacterized protein with GYD domain